MLSAKNVPGSGPRAEPLEEGTYPARLVQVIALGLQEEEKYQSKETHEVFKLYLTYEMSDEFMLNEDGEEDESKPRWISEEIPFHNIASDRAKSTKRYYALDPNFTHEGEWSELLGAPCMVTIVCNEGKGKNKGRIFNNISAVSAVREKDAKKMPALVNEPKVFDFDEPDMEVWKGLPDFLKEKIQGSVNYPDSELEELVDNLSDDKSKDVVEDEEDEEKW